MLILAQPHYEEVYEKCDPRSVQRERKEQVLFYLNLLWNVLSKQRWELLRYLKMSLEL